MAIQVRRGNESDFDASKMLPGEWAVSLDTRYVRMCFAPGIVLRMSTYDAFEADMAQIQAILAECRNIQSAVQRIQTEVNSKASLIVEYANDAKESADRAYGEAERAKTYADNAEAVTGVQIATKDRAGLIKGGNNHIAEDGTLMLITTTDSTTQPNSHAGREMVLEIGGVTEQGENHSPTNPMEIKNSVVKGIRTHHKNFLDCRGLTEQTICGVTFTPVYKGDKLLRVDAKGTNDGTNRSIYYLSKRYTEIFDGSYVFNGVNDGSIYSYFMEISGRIENGERFWTQGYNGNNNFPVNTNYISEAYIVIVQNATVDTSFYPMICKDNLDDFTYEPYTESSHTFSQLIELYGIGDVQDVITPKEVDGKYAKIVFDGLSDESISLTSSSAIGNDGSRAFAIYLSDRPAQVSNALCNRLLYCASDSEIVNAQTTNAFAIVSNGNYIRIRVEGKSTEADIRAWLQANPLEFVYQLATPTTETLPISDQIGLNSLATYDGITYVEFVYEGLEPTFKGKYGTSEAGGMTLESLLTARNNELKQELANERLSALEASVVNNI